MSEKNAYEIGAEKAALREWLEAAENTSDDDYNHARAMVMTAISKELTPKQKDYVYLNIVRGKTMVEIAQMYCVNKSTVSRTIKAGKKRLERCLRYANPRFLNKESQP